MSQVTISSLRLFIVLVISCLTLSLGGCYSPGPERVSSRTSEPGSVHPVIEQDDYVYYPGCEVYYNNTRHRMCIGMASHGFINSQPPQA